MKIKIARVELMVSFSLEECLRARGIITDFELISQRQDETKQFIIFTIKDKEEEDWLGETIKQEKKEASDERDETTAG